MFIFYQMKYIFYNFGPILCILGHIYFLKICSNNQQAELFIALQSAEWIISEKFWGNTKQ